MPDDKYPDRFLGTDDEVEFYTLSDSQVPIEGPDPLDDEDSDEEEPAPDEP